MMHEHIQSKRKNSRKYSQETSQMGYSSLIKLVMRESEQPSFHQVEEKPIQKITITSIIEELQNFEIEEKSFKANLEYVKSITKDHLKFVLLQPVALSQQGSKLLENQMFGFLWLRIVCTNAYVNKEMVIRKYEENNSKIAQGNRHIFEKYRRVQKVSKKTENKVNKRTTLYNK